MKLFALNSSKQFGELVAANLGVTLSKHEEEEFSDGEHNSRPLVSVTGEDVYLIQSLYAGPDLSINDKLCRLFFFIGALKDASAKSITAVLPYLCYARKDQKNVPNGSVTTKYMATMLEAVGADQVVTIDVHDIPAYQNAFRIPSENLEASNVFASYLQPLLKDEELVVMSPDIGGIKRAEHFMQSLGQKMDREIPLAFMEKFRKAEKLTGATVSGTVEGKTVLLVDDIISTGKTIAHAVDACKKSGASKLMVLATHGIFCEKAGEIIDDDVLQQVIVTNTIPPFRLEHALIKRKLVILDVAPLFAEAIKAITEVKV